MNVSIGLVYLTPLFVIIAFSAADKSDVHAPIDMKYVNAAMVMTGLMTVVGLVYLIKGSYQVL